MLWNWLFLTSATRSIETTLRHRLSKYHHSIFAFSHKPHRNPCRRSQTVDSCDSSTLIWMTAWMWLFCGPRHSIFLYRIPQTTHGVCWVALLCPRACADFSKPIYFSQTRQGHLRHQNGLAFQTAAIATIWDSSSMETTGSASCGITWTEMWNLKFSLKSTKVQTFVHYEKYRQWPQSILNTTAIST